MKSLGISVFLGMGQSAEENAAYLAMASHYGYNRLFTSLHIPEADQEMIIAEGRALLTLARKFGFAVTADVSPRSWESPGLEPENLKEFGVDTLRADWGFSPEQLLELSMRSGLRIEFNASTMDEAALSKFLAAGFGQGSLSAGHNYYPRPETGLSYELFCSRSRCIAAKGIPVSAFVPGNSCKRGPIFAGLPTIETHRQMTAVEAARQLWASGCVETVFFGDPLVSRTELEAVAALPRELTEPLELRATAVAPPEYGTAAMWERPHTNRQDAAECVVRSQESRTRSLSDILPHPVAQPRRRGDITIDNSLYGRYAGEMQIVLRDLPPDKRVNVVGQIAEQDLCLLDCLEPGRSFCLKEMS